MIEKSMPLYVPALRMKRGELVGLQNLAPDIAARTLPRLIVPPREERDTDLQLDMLSSESVPNAGLVLGRYWRGRSVLLEAAYLVDDFGEAGIGMWLPKMFDMARREQVNAIPIATLKDLNSDRVTAYKGSVSTDGPLKLALRIASADMVHSNFSEALERGMSRTGLIPQQCSVLADFTDADFSLPSFVSDVMQGALETLQELGLWQHIVFQGTSFPETNPADYDSGILVPRNEWIAWRQAVNIDPEAGKHLIFGDYAADSAKMRFESSGGRAYRHFRYTIEDAWLIQRGAATGRDQIIMRDVANKIVRSAHYAGRTFSYGDECIFKTAHGLAGPGNSSDWRAINTNHHITYVVAEIGKAQGMRFSERLVGKEIYQENLF